MTKSVLIEKVTEKVEGLTKKQVEAIINTVFDGMKDALARGEKIEIRGFGNFRLKQGCQKPQDRRKGAGARQKSTSLQDRQAIPSLPQ